MSECLRCGRDLKDPNALFGWRCAEKIGVDPNNVLTETEIDRLVEAYLKDVQNGKADKWHGNPLTSIGIANLSPDVLHSDLTNVGFRVLDKMRSDGTPKRQLYDLNTKKPLLEFDFHGVNTKAGKVTFPHMNVKVPENANKLQKYAADSLDHKAIPQSVYNSFRDFDKVGNVVKKGGKALAVVGIALDTVDLGATIYNDFQDDGQLGKKTVKKAANIGGSWAGAAGGAKVGGWAGSAIGTAICPGLGTVIGGFIGGLFGGIAGGLAGGAISDAIVDTAM